MIAAETRSAGTARSLQKLSRESPSNENGDRTISPVGQVDIFLTAVDSKACTLCRSEVTDSRFDSWIFFLCPLPTAFQSENALDLDNAIKRVHTRADTLDTVVKEQVIEGRKKKMKEGSWDQGSEHD